MTNKKIEQIEKIVLAVPTLTEGQLYWLEKVTDVFKSAHKYNLKAQGFLTQTALENFGDALRIHHCFSSEAFSKDKFEYTLVQTLKLSGFEASLAPRGNPGADIYVGGTGYSLKTQADRGIKSDLLWISKFRELGKGDWSDKPEEIVSLRDSFLNHLSSYEKIFVLRCLCRGPNWLYELVEIPKSLLFESSNGEIEVKVNSRQDPKPAYCRVYDANKQLKFLLYFDGGGERKLQLKNLDKSLCIVHAVWAFTIPQSQ